MLMHGRKAENARSSENCHGSELSGVSVSNASANLLKVDLPMAMQRLGGNIEHMLKGVLE